MTQDKHFVLKQTCSKSADLKITYKCGEKQWKTQNYYHFNLNIFRINFCHIHHCSNVRIWNGAFQKESNITVNHRWVNISFHVSNSPSFGKKTRIKEPLLSDTECEMHVPDIILRARNFNLGHVDYIISVGNNAGVELTIECFFIPKLSSINGFFVIAFIKLSN